MSDTRVCKTCQVEKPMTDFHAHPQSLGGRLRRCKECVAEQRRAAHVADPERRAARLARMRAFNAANPRQRSAEEKRRHHLWTRYRLRPDAYETILQSQDGRCAICRTEDPGTKNGSFHVDHDHECCPGAKSCGRCVRGLLCGNCNTGLGLLKESEDNLHAALAYLARDRP